MLDDTAARALATADADADIAATAAALANDPSGESALSRLRATRDARIEFGRQRYLRLFAALTANAVVHPDGASPMAAGGDAVTGTGRIT